MMDGGATLAMFGLDAATAARLFGWREAFAHPVTRGIVGFVWALLALTPVVFLALNAAGKLSPGLKAELWLRWRSWLVLAALMFVPVLLGAFATMAAVTGLSLLCYREFARATGLFRERTVSGLVLVGIAAVAAATFDHWYGFFVALFPLSVALICAGAILPDQPHGYLQRVALGVLAFTLFGSGLGHLGYFANDPGYRPLVLLMILAVELNDVFAFCVGKPLGRHKLAPNTSPGKTVEGALGAVGLTTALVFFLGRTAFAGTALAGPAHLLTLGVLISVVGQLGDLMLSAIKRDLGIKDMGVTIPGHGGLLDRFDSLLLVAPAVFHYVGYFVGIGLEEPKRIFF